LIDNNKIVNKDANSTHVLSFKKKLMGGLIQQYVQNKKTQEGKDEEVKPVKVKNSLMKMFIKKKKGRNIKKEEHEDEMGEWLE